MRSKERIRFYPHGLKIDKNLFKLKIRRCVRQMQFAGGAALMRVGGCCKMRSQSFRMFDTMRRLLEVRRLFCFPNNRSSREMEALVVPGTEHMKKDGKPSRKLAKFRQRHAND